MKYSLRLQLRSDWKLLLLLPRIWEVRSLTTRTITRLSTRQFLTNDNASYGSMSNETSHQLQIGSTWSGQGSQEKLCSRHRFLADLPPRSRYRATETTAKVQTLSCLLQTGRMLPFKPSINRMTNHLSSCMELTRRSVKEAEKSHEKKTVHQRGAKTRMRINGHQLLQWVVKRVAAL